MSTLTLASPGVQINEVDLSVLTSTSGQTNVFVTGFTSKGPTDEIVNVTSISDFENTFGTPSNAAERYLYQSARQILNNSPANLLVSRMPYGSGTGAGFSNSYSALVYPISAVDANGNDAPYQSATQYVVLPPVSILLTQQQYTNYIEDNNISWNENYNSSDITDASNLGRAGIIVVNPTKLGVDSLYQGYYVGLADNSNNNPATDFIAITGVNTVYQVNNGNSQTFQSVPQSRLAFTLTQPFSSPGSSISYVIESFPTTYSFGASAYNDCLSLLVFKLRASTYNADVTTLSYNVTEGYTGSLYSNRTAQNPNGGSPVTFNLAQLANQKSRDIHVLVNPNISNGSNWVNSNGFTKKVRVSDAAKNLYSTGVYQADTDLTANDVGNVPQKLDRVLSLIDTLDQPLDVTIEAGLGTIWASAYKRWTDSAFGKSSIGQPTVFDENYNLSITGLINQQNGYSDSVALKYNEIASRFVSFAEKTRQDHIFIADPLRNLFVTGGNYKTSKDPSFNFSTNIYWGLKNLYSSSTSSYAATYGNWLLVNDAASNSQVWVPSSGWVATILAQTSQKNFPWSAPAGLNRGTLTNVLDLAINPTQKQRDLLYRININPIAYFPGDGFAIYGQKTLFTKPSAFDRINVRRLFLTLEKATQRLLKYYVFEPNTFTTRARLVNSLKPIFDQAQNNNGLYAYQIVCDERNNTPDVIDANTLAISIYIQPVRTSEFILCDFIATQTGVNFNELIGTNQF
jgi:hypothetical protein